MKKLIGSIVSMLLAVLLCVPAFAACGNGESDYDEDGNVVVKVMFHVDEKSEEAQAYKKLVEAFNKKYKDEQIKASASYEARTTGASSYETTLNNMQTEGTLPDVITFDAPNCASYAASKLLWDMTDKFTADEQSKFYSLNKYDGKLYGLPIQESSAGFFYNKKIFAEAGVDVSAYTVENPWTFEQFEAVCAQLKNSGKVTFAVDMRITDTKDEMATYLLYPFIYAAGGSFASDDGLTATGYMDSAATKSGFAYLQSLVKNGYTSYQIGGQDTFFTGKVGMYLSSGWTIPELKLQYTGSGKLFADDSEWGLLPYPKGTKRASATGSWCYGITNNGKDFKKDAAVKFVKFMTSVESSKAIVAATGMIPARRDAEMNYASGSPEQILVDQLANANTPRPDTVAYPKFSTLFRSIIGDLNNSDLGALVSSKTSELQTEMNNLKNKFGK